MDAPFAFIYRYVDEEDFKQYLRLTIFVCFYLFFRSVYSNYAQQKQIRQQLIDDEKEKKEKPQREADAKQAKTDELEQEAQSFGWGKKTRRDVKNKQAVFEEQVETLRHRNQSTYDAAEDNDIEDLLED